MPNTTYQNEAGRLTDLRGCVEHRSDQPRAQRRLEGGPNGAVLAHGIDDVQQRQLVAGRRGAQLGQHRVGQGRGCCLVARRVLRHHDQHLDLDLVGEAPQVIQARRKSVSHATVCSRNADSN